MMGKFYQGAGRNPINRFQTQRTGWETILTAFITGNAQISARDKELLTQQAKDKQPSKNNGKEQERKIHTQKNTSKT